ncbi:hypothetical protein EYC80_005451 [Monilinia laxa]|uniref:BTB domain-containing protein n=1 Tax=Monilinia laxa TaxID=61186 RepID=A0A5N6KEA8_MONLA|nr:hypothetical protein EYC80_005451 [Monilinia laxa]
MMTGKLDLGSQESLSSACSSSSSSSNTPILRQREGEAKQRSDMQFYNIIDAGIRQQVEEILPFYPSYPILYLVYVLVRSTRTVKEARDFLDNTHRSRADYLPETSIKTLEDVKDDVMRSKVKDIMSIATSATVWWALYTLQVCDGDIECSTGLLFENVIDASEDPVANIATVSASDIRSPISSSAMRESLMGSSSDSESPVLGCWASSQTSGNGSFYASRSSSGLLQQTPNNLFINISEDEDEDDSATEKTATLGDSLDYNDQRAVTIGKGKEEARSDPIDYSSKIDMDTMPSSKEKFPMKKHEEKNIKCKFCDRDLENWLAKPKHEISCHMRIRQVCVKCKKEVQKSNIRRHESGCDGLQFSRRDGSELEDRDVSVASSIRTSRSGSRFSDIESDPPTYEELQKVKQMQQVLPHLSEDQCITNLKLSEGDLEAAIHTEMEFIESNDEDSARGSYDQQDNPSKRKSEALSVERTIKKPRLQDSNNEAFIQPASQWIRTTFLDLCQDSTKLTVVHISRTGSRSIPTKLMCDNSEYLKDLINPTGNQDATLKEIELQDVEPALFDAIIQYMVCSNVSFGPQVNEIQTVTTIVNFLVLAERFKVTGAASTLLEPLEAILKQDRKGPYPKALKVGHVHKIFSVFEDTRHPIRKLFVKASVLPFMKEKNENNPGEDYSDTQSKVDAKDVNFRNKPAHFAWKLNKDFATALMAKVSEALENRMTRRNSRNSKSFTVYYTDPFDDSQFTLLG